MSSEFATLWQRVLSDLDRPDVGWQIAALVVGFLLALLADRFVRGRDVREGKVWQIGHGGLKRVIFPLVALVLAIIFRAALRPYLHTNLLSLAIPLMGSLAVIRFVFYVLRYSFAQSAWLGNFERLFALLVWSVVVMHITGFLPEIIEAMESVTFQVGKEKLNIWLVLQGITTVLGTVFVALWIAGVVETQLNRAVGLDENLRLVLARLSKALLVVMAVLIGLPLVGIDLTTLSVFGGALGVGLGFGLQKIASNYVSGFILLLDRSIRIGNLITVGTDRGVVTLITTRYTVLKSYSGIEALVPNELLVGSVVKNETYSDSRVRISLLVQVSYDSDLERALVILREVADAQPRVTQDPPPDVMVRDFADSGIVLQLGLWIADPAEGTGLLRSSINLAIWRAFKKEGIVFPFPQREVRILGPVPDSPAWGGAAPAAAPIQSNGVVGND